MKSVTCVIKEILDICPTLASMNGYIFIGTCSQEPPYSNASYQKWRLVDGDENVPFESKIALDRVFASMLDDYGFSKGMPHGFFKIEKSIISFQWSSSDIVETMLSKVGGERVGRH